MTEDQSSCFPARFIIFGIFSLAHFASVATSFEVSFPAAGGGGKVKSRSTLGRLSPEKPIVPRRWSLSLQPRVSSAENHDQEQYGRPITSLSFIPGTSSARSKTVKLSLSSGEPDDMDEATRRENLNAAHDDLYNFLTGKTGQGTGGESERVRKRDQIMGFMGRGSGSGSEKQLIQPIRQEDGMVDEELVVQQQQEERTKVKFDNLFAGMPTLEEIISRNPAETEEETSGAGTKTRRKTRMTDDDDFSWFETERLQIEREYEQLRQETKQRIREQRLEEEEIEHLIQAIAASENDGEDADGLSRPSTIPDNAEGVADAIITQEMNQMIDAVQLERAKQRLQAFESEKTTELDSRDYQGVSDNVVDNIIKETADEIEQREKLKASAVELEQYERLRQQEASFKEAQEQNVPQDGLDLDNWTLDRLNEMLEKSENQEDGDGSIAEMLEENIEELRKQIQRESKKGSIEPQTMKEWQMYQAIATKLTKDQQIQSIGANSDMDAFDAMMNDGGAVDDDDANYESNVDEQKVAQQLDSWRDYIETEDKLRQKMSLSSGYELPFGHLGDKMDQIEAARAEESAFRADIEAENKGKSRREVRREVNIQAVQAMEDLIRKSDGPRAEFLKKQLEEIKEGMEETDYYDTEEEEEELISLEPVDLTDVFAKSKDDDPFSPEEMEDINQVLSSSETGAQYTKKSESVDEPVQKQEPPNTPFFSDSVSESQENQPSVPDTPFFQDQETITEEEIIDVKNKLGSADEQKLQKMFRQANVRSYAEQDAIRKNWEEYQEYEKGIRDKVGLSKQADGEESPSLTEGVELDYDVKDFMTEDGDFDAEKVLSTIGPRPKKRTKPSEPSTSTTGDSKSDIDSNEVADAIYRSVAATGGIGREDQAVRKKDREGYEAYLKKEQEMKMGLDKLEDEIEEVESEVAEFEDLDINDPDYAEEVLEPRPFVKRKRKLDEGALSDMGGFLAGSTNLDEEEDSDEEDDDSGFDNDVPDWLKKEREAAGQSQGGGVWRRREKKTAGRSDNRGVGGAFLGIGDDDVDGDDTYGRETLEEYEKRKAGQRTNMGIDIRDALGRRGSDDPVDYKYGNDRFGGKQSGWGQEDFEARKTRLLGYIQLDVSEVNNLIALKESVFATGASKYLPRINKPFQEFGAIFRLEGVLVDITGLEQKVWNRVATEFGLEEPLLEDIRRAAVLKPEDAVKEVFFTAMGDFILVRRIVDAYRRIFRQEFNAWASEEGIAAKYDEIQKKNNANSRRSSFAIGFDEEDEAVDEEVQEVSVPPDEGSKLRYLQEIWTKTANQFGFPPPTNGQIAESSMVSPDIAVSNIFCWSEEQRQINKIVSAFSMLQAGKSLPVEEKKPTSPNRILPTDRPLTREEITDDMILELQLMAWGEVAEENSFEVPDAEKVVAAASINNPRFAILDGFGWTDDPSLAAELAANYEDYFSEYINRYINNRPFTPASTENVGETAASTAVRDSNALNSAPTTEEKEILSRQTDAWRVIATEFGFDVPSTEQIISVADMTPEDAVIKVLLTNYDIEKCSAEEEEDFYETLPEIVELYESALKNPESTSVRNDASPSRDESVASGMTTEEAIFSRQADAWKEIATEYGLNAPTMEQMRLAVEMSLEDAVHKLILMNNDIESCSPEEVEEFYEMLPEIIEAFESALEKPSTNTSQKSEPALETDPQQVSQDEIYCASFDAWTSVAWKLGYRLPTQEDVQFAMTVGPKEAVVGGFRWTESEEEAGEIVQRYLNQIKGRRDEWVKQGYKTTIVVENNEFEEEELPMVQVLPDVLDWIKSLKAVEMGCGVVSHLENDQMKILLEYAGLSELFPEGNQVSHSNGYLLDNQQLLGTALRIERRPDHCVVFDTSPPACAAAHDFDMRSVALIGPFPRYELLDADTSAASVNELTASNIRRLFGERIYDKPMLDTEGENPLDPSKRVQIKTQFEGDE